MFHKYYHRWSGVWSFARTLFTILTIFLFILFNKALSHANDSSVILEADNSVSNPPGVKQGPPAPPLHGPASPKYLLGVSTDATYVSRYIWHGLDYSYQKPVLQPEMILSLMNISAIVWLNYDFQSYNAVNEYDLTLQYSNKLGPTGISLGYTYLTYPHRNFSDSEEIWIQASYESVLNPTLGIHGDFRSENGWYSNLGISHYFDLPIGKLAPAALLYYHSHCYGGTGFPASEFNVADAISFGQTTSTIKISYYRALKDGDFQDLGDQVVYSFNLSWSLP